MRKIGTVVFYVAVTLLVVANVRLLLFQPKFRNISEYGAPRIDEPLPRFRITTHLGANLELPFANKEVTLLYYGGMSGVTVSDIAVSDIAYIQAIANSGLGNGIGAVLCAGGREGAQVLYSYVGGSRLHVVRDTRSFLESINRLDMRPGSVIISYQDTVRYEGEILRPYLYLQIADILSSATSHEAATTVSVGDKVDDSIFREGVETRLSELPGITVLLLYSSYCATCKSSEIFRRIKAKTDVPVYPIIPHWNNDYLVETIVESERRIPLYTLSMDSSGIAVDSFLPDEPTVLIMVDSYIEFVSNVTTDEEDITREVLRLKGRTF